MRLNKKSLKFLLFFVLIIIVVYSFYFSNRPRNLNILLITIDSLRSDHLGCYGYKRNTSPNIDKLAKEGVMFTQAIAQAPWTGGSLASLLTSTYPSTHKINDFGCILDERLLTLVQILKTKNYYTLATSGGDWIYKDFPGFERGFSSFIDTCEADEVAKQTKDWLRKLQNRKFFIWIHFFDYPHAPYNPPYPFNQRFRVNNNSKHIPIGKGKEFFNVIPSWVAIKNMTAIDYYISQYDGEIAFVDSLVGKILDTLRSTKLDKKTIVIISADHGESLGERGIYFQHNNCLYNEEIRVPLIIKGKGIPKGKKVHSPVGLIDIMPTLLDILGIKVNLGLEGKSFYSLILNERQKCNNFVFSEANVTKVIGNSVVNAEQKSVIHNKWKLIYEISSYGIRYELYNLEADPLELNNLVEREKEKFQFLKAKLEEWMNRPKPEIKPLTKPLDEETKEKLKGLGYLQ